MRRHSVTGAILLVAGLWLLIVPSLLFEHSRRAATGDYALGALIVLSALASFRAPRVALAALGLGFYLALMPFVLGYSGTAHQVHDLVVGIGIAGLAYATARADMPILVRRR